MTDTYETLRHPLRPSSAQGGGELHRRRRPRDRHAARLFRLGDRGRAADLRARHRLRSGGGASGAGGSPPCRSQEGLRASASTGRRSTDVIISHMHYDHAGNLGLFPNARFHMQDAEMAYCTGRCMCHPIMRFPFEAAGRRRPWCARCSTGGCNSTTATASWRPGSPCTSWAATPRDCR